MVVEIARQDLIQLIMMNFELKISSNVYYSRQKNKNRNEKNSLQQMINFYPPVFNSAKKNVTLISG